MDKRLRKEERPILSKVAATGVVKFMNDRPFTHFGHHGTVLTADRCDFKGGVVVNKPKDITEKHLIQDMMEIAAWHAIHIHPKLNGFQGYDAFEITLISH